MSTTRSSDSIWYRFLKRPFHGHDPCVFNKDHLPWVATIEDNAEVIREEVKELIDRQEGLMKPYRFHKPQRSIYEWQTIPFLSWKYRNHRNCKYIPHTMAILESIPNVVSVSLSWMAPDTHITEHRGDTNAIVRSHLGISVPGKLPDCGFRVCNEKRSWEEGTLLSFCDAQPHEAWNFTNTERIVLIIDVVRHEYTSLVNHICATIIATHLLQALDKRLDFYSKLSPKSLEQLLKPVEWFVRAALPVQRAIPVL